MAATPAHRLIQGQNLDIPYNGPTLRGKADATNTEKKGGIGGRKALNDISNSRKIAKRNTSTNVISTGKNLFAASATNKGGKLKYLQASENVKGGVRKALNDLTNSVKPSSQNTSRKLNSVAEESFRSCCIADEKFLHNHDKCIKAQAKGVDLDFFLKSVGLENDIPVKLSAAKKPEKRASNFEMEDMSEQCFEDQSELSVYCSPWCRSPKSPKAPYMNWNDDKFAGFVGIVDSPKLKSP